MTFKCPICKDSFERRVVLDKHLREVHHDNPSPYECDTCEGVFGTEKALRSHKRKKHETDGIVDNDSKRAKTTTVDFNEWVVKCYNPRKTVVKERLSESTVRRIIQFEQVNSLGCPISELLQSTNDEDTILNTIDLWIDGEMSKYEVQTVNNHVRYLSFLILFYTETYPVKDSDNIIQYMNDIVHNVQLLTSKSASTLNVLKIEDPYALSAIRDRVVNALRIDQVEHIDPYIISVINRGEQNVEDMYAFGTRLRNWLELAIRFTNIPCRIQCTQDLRNTTYESYDYVAKLICRSDNQYHRLINMDKTGSTTHQPISIPLGRTLSTYLYYYVTYFRPGDTDYVFVTKNGSKWTKASRDLKTYLNNVLHIPVDEIDPTGRFIHASRSIMMAAFAIHVDFNTNRMHEFARLMRHSSTTSEHYYSIWQQKYASENAIHTFSRVFEVDIHTEHTVLSTTKTSPVGLAMPSSIIRHHYLCQSCDDDNRYNKYETRSVGTQTNDTMENVVSFEQKNKEIDIATTIPSCPSCKELTLDVYGPFGSKRRKWYYGRYYLACTKCHRDPLDHTRFRLTECLWYPLGYTPKQKSKSTKPRNLEQIYEYIHHMTNNNKL